MKSNGYSQVRRRDCHGITLIEMMVATAILALLFMSGMSVIQFHRIQSRKAMEYAIMLDFAEHYLELARSQRFDRIRPGQHPVTPG